MHSSTSFLSTCVTGLLALSTLQGAYASPSARRARRDLQGNSLYTLTAVGPGVNATLAPWDTGLFAGFQYGPCPAEIAPDNCTAGHTMVVAINNSTVSLNTKSSHQQLFLATATGRLSYIEPGSTVPISAGTTGFSIQPSSQPGSAGNLVFQGSGVLNWMTCPDQIDTAIIPRLFANVTGITDSDVTGMLPIKVSNCTRVDVALTPTTDVDPISSWP